MLFIFYFLFFDSIIALTLIDNLQLRQVLDDHRYCDYPINQDQRKWNMDQRPEQWLNISFPIYDDQIQITSLDYNQTIGSRNVLSYVCNYNIDYVNHQATISICYWSRPWILYLSYPWYKQCPDVIIKYGNL